MKNLIWACGLTLLSLTSAARLQAANEHKDRVEYLIIDEVVIIRAIPDHITNATSVEVILRSNGGVLGVQYTTPGHPVQFTAPDNATGLSVLYKYVTDSGLILIVDDIATS